MLFSPNIRNQKRFSKNGKGVYYFPSHKEVFLGKRGVVIGGGDTAIDATLELLNLAEEITLANRKEGFRAFDENVDKVKRSGLVDIVLNAELKAIEGRDSVKRVVIRDQQRVFRKNADAVIISIGIVPKDAIFKDLKIRVDKNGFILTDNAQRTSLEGVFAIGDVVRGGLRLITVAATHGAIASHYIYSYLKRPYWTREK